jgi:MarR family transcriptional regulator for hemolysin
MNQDTPLSDLRKTVFYALDKAIKSYRQFAQRNIRQSGLDITIDQWLVLKTILDHPDLTQKEIAAIVFKDYASITRIIDLLVKRGYLRRSPHPADKRQHQLDLTTLGKGVYSELVPIIASNRQTALEGISEEEVQVLQKLLQRITHNCT